MQLKRRTLGSKAKVSVPNQDFVVQEGQLRYFAAPRAIVLVATPLGVHKACHLAFARSDGSIFVQFPYFTGGTKGVLSAVSLASPHAGPTTVDLAKHGKVASALVKFSHHPDGRVNFSQDAKVRTEIIRQSWPLATSIGQIFTLNFYHLRGLDLLDRVDMKPRKLFLPFAFTERLPFAVSIAAEWRRKTDIIANIDPPGGTTGPVPVVQSRKTGGKGPVFFLGQPASFPLRDHLLMVTCEAIPLLDGTTSPTAILLGGWDGHEVTAPGQQIQGTGFLAAMYPCVNFNTLATRVGSLDYSPRVP